MLLSEVRNMNSYVEFILYFLIVLFWFYYESNSDNKIMVYVLFDD